MNEFNEVTDEIKQKGWDLASRIRFLREEIKEGRGNKEKIDELNQKIQELTSLVPSYPHIRKFCFEIKDILELDGVNELGYNKFVFCRRIVEVANPNYDPYSSKPIDSITISLLPKGVNPQDLIEAPKSEVLPPAYGGI